MTPVAGTAGAALPVARWWGPCHGVPDTVEFRAALREAKPGVQSAAARLQEAEANPMDRAPIKWEGDDVSGVFGNWLMDAFGDDGLGIVDDEEMRFWNDDGISCEGSGAGEGWVCTAFGLHGDVITKMLNYTVAIDPKREYDNNEPIICTKGPSKFTGLMDTLLVWGHFCLHMVDVPSKLTGAFHLLRKACLSEMTHLVATPPSTSETD